MASSGPLTTLLYTSELAGSDAAAVAAIARQARAANAIHGITGLLAFDGHNFAQRIEGPPDAIAQLRSNLQKDRRHRAMAVQFVGPGLGPRRYPDWLLGYLLVDDEERDLRQLAGMRGPDALATFDRLMGPLDVEVGLQVPGER